MQVPADVATRSDVLVATHRSSWSGALVNEGFTLGPYVIKHVDRKWDMTTGFIAGNLSHSNTEGGYAFAFEGAGAAETGHCASGKKDTGLKFSSGVELEFQFSKLACSCVNGPRQATVVVESSGDAYRGSLVTTKGTYSVASVHELVGGGRSIEPVGYRIDGDSCVGAAEILRPGKLWLDRSFDPDERADIACLVVGLLLYVPQDKL
jgi:hypothetical protein